MSQLLCVSTQEKRRRELAITSLQLAATSALPALPGPRQGNGRPGNTQLDALRPVLQANLRNQAAGMGLPHHRNLLVESMQNLSGKLSALARMMPDQAKAHHVL